MNNNTIVLINRGNMGVLIWAMQFEFWFEKTYMVVGTISTYFKLTQFQSRTPKNRFILTKSALITPPYKCQ